MAQCDGDCIGGVVGLGCGVQVEDAPGHVLDLVLGGVAVANNGLLDLHGLVLVDGHPRLLDGQQDHAPALGHADAGGDVLAEEELFDGHAVGLAASTAACSSSERLP